MTLTEAEFEVFELLTSRPFLVIDTEYTWDPATHGSRIISLAIVPVVSGKVLGKETLYIEMHPGVTIHPTVAKLTGFTNKSVKKKRKFGAHAKRILEHLDIPGAIIVEHTSSDVPPLRHELAQLDSAKAAGNNTVAVGLADLPDLPILDTSTLAHVVSYPKNTKRTVSLARLCEMTGVSNATPHHARSDARATAECLVELLKHAATTGEYGTIEAILNEQGRGTTSNPAPPVFIRSRRATDITLPAEHIAKHATILGPEAVSTKRAWLKMAVECATLRCPYLQDDIYLSGDADADRRLLDRLFEKLGTMTEPGQAGTLLGAVAEMIEPSYPDGHRALKHAGVSKFWEPRQMKVRSSTPCGSAIEEQCPDCRQGRACPRDTLYQNVAWAGAVGPNTEITHDYIKTQLFRSGAGSSFDSWRQKSPDIAGYMAWMVIMHDRTVSNRRSGTHLNKCIQAGLHLVEPRLTLLACEAHLATKGIDEVTSWAAEVLAKRTTDSAFEKLEAWLTWSRQVETVRNLRSKQRIITSPRQARPEGRENSNPFALA
jgi:DNA polymerase III epsilon subunit-like protein